MRIKSKSTIILDLEGKIAVVTGGDSGIGRGIVKVLAAGGAMVFVASRNLEKVRKTASELVEKDLQVFPVQMDITDQLSVNCAIDKIISDFGQIDILVNNAGVIAAPGWEKRPEQVEDDWDVVYAVNIKGTARVTEAVAAHMKNKKYGKIINISSIAGRHGNESHVPYAYGVSKAGLINLTQTLALRLAPYNINVNAVCPGIVWTDMWEKIAARLIGGSKEMEGLSPSDVFDSHVRRRIPLNRPQQVEDIAYAVAFLASEYAKNITGQSLNVSGGSHMN